MWSPAKSAVDGGDEGCLKEVAEMGVDAAAAAGVLFRTAEKPNSTDVVQFAPFSLFPSPIPKSLFYQARAVQLDFNFLVHKIAADREFLRKSLAETVQVDEFTRRLWDIYSRVTEEGVAQSVQLGIFRSDYMIDVGAKTDDSSTPLGRIKQIEINTIASSFGGLATEMADVHRRILRRTKGLCREMAEGSLEPERVPDNEAMVGLADGIAHAKKLYESQRSDASTLRFATLFVVEEESRNVFDQRRLETEIGRRRPDAVVLRRTLGQVAKAGVLDAKTKALTMGEWEIDVAYLRAGYAPDQYLSDAEWSGRLKLERSLAIKCPSISLHLVTAKKIQQAVAAPGVLERFFAGDDDAVNRVRATFTGLYPIDDSDAGKKAFERALAHPENFVLKPQREGGANNYYGSDIPRMLRQICSGGGAERAAYILMDRIHPVEFDGVLMRPGAELKVERMVSELGIFGVFISDGQRVLRNQVCGHLVRTKQSYKDEGGVAAGFAGIDSPYLI